MIRTNLSTRPFYNVRAVHAAIGALAVVVVAITLFNVIEIVRLTALQRTLGAQATQSEQQAARLRAEAARILGQINTEELEAVAKAAREANAIIDQRTFSWTNLFTHFEATLPPDVRIMAITPQPARKLVIIGAEARGVEDLDQFIEGLEMSGEFHNVLPTTEQTMDNGMIQASIDATYVEPATPQAEAKP